MTFAPACKGRLKPMFLLGMKNAARRADDGFFAAGIKRRRSKADFAPTWYARRDSNPQHSEPESDALSIELRALFSKASLL